MKGIAFGLKEVPPTFFVTAHSKGVAGENRGTAHSKGLKAAAFSMSWERLVSAHSKGFMRPRKVSADSRRCVARRG